MILCNNFLTVRVKNVIKGHVVLINKDSKVVSFNSIGVFFGFLRSKGQ
jgi:hypothetical protein